MSERPDRVRRHDEHPVGLVILGGLLFTALAVGTAAILLMI